MGKLSQIYADYLTSRPDRPSNGHISVSQVLACPHQAWHEHHEGLKRTFDAPTQSKFAMGHDVEDSVRTALKAGLAQDGWTLVDNPEEGMEISPDVWGHPDLIFHQQSGQRILTQATDANRTPFKIQPIEYVVVEVKSTMLFYDRVRKGVFLPSPEELQAAQPQYFLQAAAYGHAYNAKHGYIFLVDRGTGLFEDYPFDVEAWYKLFQVRADLLAADLKREMPPDRYYPEWTEKKGKGYGYVCKQCPVLTCPKWSLAN